MPLEAVLVILALFDRARSSPYSVKLGIVGVNTSLSIVDYSVYSAGLFAESTAGGMTALRWVIRGVRDP